MTKKIYLFFTLLLIGLLISKGADAILYSKEALFLCGEMIIPSLFPFFVCSGILVYSGFCRTLAKIFSPVMKPLFNINPNGSSAFVLGIISGYPAGAITACQLYESGYLSKSETERLLAFCNNSGPLFILGSVGIGLYMGLETGIILYTAHVIGALLVGLCMRFYASDQHSAPEYTLSTDELSFSEIFRISATNAVNSMLLICGTILFFSVASRLFLGLFPFKLPPFVYGLFEFSGGNVFIADSEYPLSLKLVMSAIVTGFAGLSVHMQVLAVTAKHRLSVTPYFLGKIMHGLFSGAVVYLLFKAKPVSQVAFGGKTVFDTAFVLAPLHIAICLLFVAILFALAWRRRA